MRYKDSIQKPAIFGLTTLILIAAIFPISISAQDAEGEGTESPESPFSNWSCSRCPEQTGWLGAAEFGIGWVSDDSLRYGNYRGLEDDGPYLPLDGEARFSNSEGRYFKLSASDLALDSREIEMKGGQEGRYDLYLSWNEIPTYRGYGAQTPFLGQGDEHLRLPDNWQRGATPAEMPLLQESLNPAPMKLQRKVLDAGATMRFSGAWSAELEVQRQKKTGTRPFGGAGVFYNDTSQILAPVDFTTDRVNAGLNWSSPRVQLRLGFLGSWFDNGDHSLTWDNPFTAGPGVDQFRAALEPSNDFYQFDLTGAWIIRPNLHLSGHAAVGEMTQDEAFLPYSINPDFENVALPRTSLDGKVETSVANLGGKFFARINSRLSITAKADYDERDNQTPVSVYEPVNSDFLVLRERENRPYSFERTRYSADFRFRAFRKLRFAGGARWQELERTLQAIEDSEEKTWWGEVKFTPFNRSHLRLSLESSDRDTSEYQAVTDSGRVDHPLFRKYNQADRDRDLGKLEAFYSNMSGLGVNISIHYAEDDYDESVLGLQNSEVRGLSLSLDQAIGTGASVYGFVTQDEIESEMFGQSGALQWTGNTEDRISTVGAGFSAALESDKEFGVDLVWADSRGDIDVLAGSAKPFPALKTTLKNLRFRFDHDVNDHWGYRLYAEYESFDSSDWAIDGFGVDGVDSVLMYGLISPNYDIWNVYAQASYRF